GENAGWCWWTWGKHAPLDEQGVRPRSAPASALVLGSGVIPSAPAHTGSETFAHSARIDIDIREVQREEGRPHLQAHQIRRYLPDREGASHQRNDVAQYGSGRVFDCLPPLGSFGAL